MPKLINHLFPYLDIWLAPGIGFDVIHKYMIIPPTDLSMTQSITVKQHYRINTFYSFKGAFTIFF